ncbi:3260_t:CDS:2, partial [Ambispora leptoticha]
SKNSARSGSPANRSVNGNAESHSGKNSPSPSSNSPTTSAANAHNWKVVGSPPTRVISSVPPSPEDYQNYHTKKIEEENQEQKMRRPSSTPSTPQRPINGNTELTSRLLASNSPSPPTKMQQLQNTANGNNDKWGTLGGLQWPGIWNEKNQQQNSGSSSKPEPNHSNSPYEREIGSPPGIGKLPVPVPPHPQYRQHRSSSFSVGQHDPDLFGYAPTSRRESEGGLRLAYNRHSLAPTMEEDTDEFTPYGGRFRARSKSSAAAYGIISGHQDIPHEDLNDYRRESEQYSDSGALWNNHVPQNDGPILHHRRSVPSSSEFTGMWDNFNSSAPPSSASAYLAVMAGMPEREKLRQRRFSLQAPTYAPDYHLLDNTQEIRLLNHRAAAMDPGYAHLVQRRHSVAGPAISFNPSPQARYLSDALESLHLNNVQPVSYTNDTSYSSIPEDIDDYFDNNEQRTRAWNELGKGLPLHAIPTHGPLYLVEFKAGRTDLFYVAENSGAAVKKGDLVIVEADRGKDLGKVTNDSITPHQVQLLQQQQADAMTDGHRMNKEIHPKRIYRLAQPAEITMLVTKNQDEAKAMLVCQNKVRQKKLPMEVVDAEYQWDRRKLTFYFIAERRIDFRELVRDLFKIYKTRIWMCAVNPLMNKPKK